MKAVLWALVGAMVMFVVVVDPLGVSPVDGWLGLSRGQDVGSGIGSGDGSDAGLWTCGMHPNVIQKEPGICPICRMDLTPLRTDEPIAGAEGHEDRPSELWMCPMHSEHIQEEEPGICPICGMELVPVRSEDVGSGAGKGIGIGRDGTAVTID